MNLENASPVSSLTEGSATPSVVFLRAVRVPTRTAPADLLVIDSADETEDEGSHYHVGGIAVDEGVHSPSVVFLGEVIDLVSPPVVGNRLPHQAQGPARRGARRTVARGKRVARDPGRARHAPGLVSVQLVAGSRPERVRLG